MKCKLGCFLLLGLALAGATAADCRAEGVWWWGGGPGGFGYNRMVQTDRQIPYFAEFPPVYYSGIVPRTYGQSPYAYWPGPFTPQLCNEPAFIDNPYVEPEAVQPAEEAPNEKPKAKAKSTGRTAARSVSNPSVVFNPYVDQPRAVANAR